MQLWCWQAVAIALTRPANPTRPTAASSASRRRPRGNAWPARGRPLQSRLTRLEQELAKVSDELRELDAQLADPDFYHAGDEAVVAETLKRRGELSRKVESLEAQWLELTQEIEAIE